MAVEWTTTKFGNPQVIIDGHPFVKNKESKGTTYWRCHKCPVTASTIGEAIVAVIGDHNHVADPSLLLKKKFKTDLRQNTEKHPNMPNKEIFAVTRRELDTNGITDNEVVSAVGTFNNNRGAIRYNKNKKKPREPQSLAAVNLEGEWTETIDGESLILANDGEDQRIIIFGTNQLLNLLCQATVVYMDGTFKKAPNKFYQIYSIHFEYKKCFLTGVVALLPNKEAETYKRFLQLIRGKALTLGANFAPDVIQIDYESGMMKAVRVVFPESTRIRGCLFHFAQKLIKRMNKELLSKMYKESTVFRIQFNRIKALALLDINQVDEAMEEITDALISLNDNKVNNFLHYVKRVWTDETAKFPKSIWSHWENEGPRTTNCVEGWHNKLRTRIMNNPTLYKFIELLKELQEETDYDILLLRNNVQPKTKNKKYLKLDQEILELVNQFKMNQIDRNYFLDHLSSKLTAKYI